jgi:hypothetical protein
VSHCASLRQPAEIHWLLLVPPAGVMVYAEEIFADFKDCAAAVPADF